MFQSEDLKRLTFNTDDGLLNDEVINAYSNIYTSTNNVIANTHHAHLPVDKLKRFYITNVIF